MKETIITSLVMFNHHLSHRVQALEQKNDGFDFNICEIKWLIEKDHRVTLNIGSHHTSLYEDHWKLPPKIIQLSSPKQYAEMKAVGLH